jgi:sulfite exporter TauE/SafE
MNWSDYVGIFLLGLSGTGHCLGMCGAFSLAVSAGAQKPITVVWRQISYQLGKATSYAFIGVVLLLVSGAIDARWPLLNFQNALGWAVGVVMIAMGIAYVAELRMPTRAALWWQGSAVCGATMGLWRSPSLWRSLLIGWVNGFLPCGLSLMALMALANRGSTLGVVVGSYVFGFATLPGLLAVGLLGQRIDVAHRRWLVRLGGIALIAFGVLTLVRGTPIVHAWMHQHLMFGGNEATPELCH